MASASGSTPSRSSSNPTITVEKNISKSRLAELGIKGWPKWACPPGKYTMKYDSEETMYLVKGKVKADINNPSCAVPAAVEFCAGDLVVIPKGLSCTWNVTASVDKHYKFEPSPAPPSPSGD